MAAFLANLEREVLRLERELQDGSYRPGRYTKIEIHDPKHRIVSAAPFRDRVVHHALCAVCEPIFERGFVYDSYANRVGPLAEVDWAQISAGSVLSAQKLLLSAAPRLKRGRVRLSQDQAYEARYACADEVTVFANASCCEAGEDRALNPQSRRET